MFTLPAGCGLRTANCELLHLHTPAPASVTACRLQICGRGCHSDITSIICHIFLSQSLTLPLRILKSPGTAVNAQTRLRTRACPAIHITREYQNTRALHDIQQTAVCPLQNAADTTRGRSLSRRPPVLNQIGYVILELDYCFIFLLTSTAPPAVAAIIIRPRATAMLLSSPVSVPVPAGL